MLAVKDIFDSMHLLTYIPRQKLGKEQPEIIVKTSGSITSTTLYVEVEVATKYQLEKRKKKMERAFKDNAIPVFVFKEKGPVVSAVRSEEFKESIFVRLHGNAMMILDKDGWVELKNGDSLLAILNYPSKVKSQSLETANR